MLLQVCQGLRQLHVQPEFPCGSAELDAQQTAGRPVDADILPTSHRPRHRPGELHPPAQLPRLDRPLPRAGAGAVGHLQGQHAQHHGGGDPDREDAAAGVAE